MSDQLTGTQDALSSTIAAFNAVCAERDAAIARAEAAEALAASRLDVSPEDVGAFLMYHDVPDGHEHINGAGKRVHAPDRVYAALRAHAAKVSR